MHTKDTIQALLNRKDEAVRRALYTVKRACGFFSCDVKFGESLIGQMDRGSKLTENQLRCARQLLGRYLAVLARVANENQNSQETNEDKAYAVAAERKQERLAKEEPEPEIDF